MNKFFTVFAAVAAAAFSMEATNVAYAPQVKMDAPQVDDKVIFDAPDGELSWLDRTCDGFVTTAFQATHGQILGSVVQMVEGEDGYVYLSHMASEYPVNTWTRFEREGNTLVMNGVQAIYVEYDEDYEEELIVYLAPMKVEINENNVGTFVVTDDCRYVLNIGEDGSLTSADPKMLLGVCVHTPDETVEGNAVWIWKGFGDRDIKMVPAKAEPVAVPEGIAVANWVMFDGFRNNLVHVAIDGDDFYINGLDRSLPEAWVKGKIADGKVTFPSGQYLGADMEIYYYSYFCGAEFSMEENEDGEQIQVARYADSAIFDYDAEEGKLSMVRGYIINSTPNELFPLYFYDDVSIYLQHRNPATAPAAPYGLEYINDDWGKRVWFMIPNVDVEGNMLNMENLFYEVYVNGELQYFDISYEEWNLGRTSRIPYLFCDWYYIWMTIEDPEDHTVYFDYDGEVKSVGIRSIYVNENGEDVYSQMGYWGDPTSAATIEGSPVDVKWYDLQGRPLSGKSAGIAIKVATYSDGTIVRSKVLTAE
ncbi:MAG: hypothetical protein K2L17_02165 [Muribaculaceae bacterium]|nr:hypothetical protein [Muribaculaceae bacterium]